uniref:Calcineurin-like phosphoesterase domain-containing protein n=1 Tax=Corethron hystrix TaxID=216773 RepID=A0A7S1C177_9STRA|mmetsp:Transcript_744/g.1519  ORF Transcript_744/g.1519 Transcript_744/m.1519 type:complete len:432 (+) Transcript_744:167-1462(+)
MRENCDCINNDGSVSDCFPHNDYEIETWKNLDGINNAGCVSVSEYISQNGYDVVSENNAHHASKNSQSGTNLQSSGWHKPKYSHSDGKNNGATRSPGSENKIINNIDNKRKSHTDESSTDTDSIESDCIITTNSTLSVVLGSTFFKQKNIENKDDRRNSHTDKNSTITDSVESVCVIPTNSTLSVVEGSFKKQKKKISCFCQVALIGIFFSFICYFGFTYGLSPPNALVGSMAHLSMRIDSPTNVPSGFPSQPPTFTTSDVPSDLPSDLPSSLPSFLPSTSPNFLPSFLPSSTPTEVPPKTGPVVFYAMGDMPYTNQDVKMLPTQIRNLNAYDGEFLVHIGDFIKHKNAPKDKCPEKRYQMVNDILIKSPVKTFIIPGDNGDFHKYKTDFPWDDIPNLGRVQLDKGALGPPLLITVQSGGQKWPFTFDRRL